MIRPLNHLSHIAIAAALLVVALVSPAWGQATGSAGAAPAPACAISSTDTDPLTAVRDLRWQGRKGVARACWVGGQGRQGNQVVLELQVEGQPLLRHSIPADQSLEGSLDELRFDNARFALSEPPERRSSTLPRQFRPFWGWSVYTNQQLSVAFLNFFVV